MCIASAYFCDHDSQRILSQLNDKIFVITDLFSRGTISSDSLFQWLIIIFKNKSNTFLAFFFRIFHILEFLNLTFFLQHDRYLHNVYAHTAYIISVKRNNVQFFTGTNITPPNIKIPVCSFSSLCTFLHFSHHL